MSMLQKHTPLARYEHLEAGDPWALTGRSWEVQPNEHVGHRMKVVGQIHDDTLGPRAMFVVECSCGKHFRVSKETIGKRLREEGE